jgi:recombination protein RecA
MPTPEPIRESGGTKVAMRNATFFEVSMGSQPTKERLGAVQAAIKEIVTEFGKGAIMKLGERSVAVTASEALSTGSLSLDLALGGYGLPRGRIAEVFGPESSGKTTLCMTVVANVQRAGGIAAYIDAEHAVDPTYCGKLGVDVNALLLSQPDSGEQALEIVDRLIRSNGIDVIVVDSVSALVPQAELEGEMGAAHVGLQARLMSQALRKLTAAIARSRATVIFINQIREKIGVMFGNPETTSGGRALKFFSSVRLDVRRKETLKDGDVAIGTRVKASVVKNKVAPPFQKAEFDLLFESGISRAGDAVDLGEQTGALLKTGNYYDFEKEKLGPGRDRAIQVLRENPALAERLERAIRRKLGAEAKQESAAVPEPDRITPKGAAAH